MTIVDAYLDGLRNVLSEDQRDDLALATGAPSEQLAALRKAYPACPASLLELLGKINGTYWQTYGDKQIAVLILGSDVYEYPYYLLSAEQMLEEAQKYGDSIADIYGDQVHTDHEMLDPRIDGNIPMRRRLCFSHCMNNGGTSILYVDFNPTRSGVVGQVVRFLHDPDSYVVIANSFDEYLQGLIDGEYEFLLEDE
jgi:hypothetical protein